MDTRNPQKPDEGRLLPAEEPPIIIEPLNVKRPSRSVREIEALVVGLQVALVTELNAVKGEILQRIGEVEESVEMLARQTARKEDEGDRSSAAQGAA